MIRVPVSGRVAQCTQRIERLDRLLRGGGIVHRLRLVDDHDGIGTRHEVRRPVPGKLVPLLAKNPAVRLAPEGIDVDHHDLELIAGSELPHFPQLLGIVNEVVVRHLIVDRAEMLARHFQGLERAFTDRDGWHHDDEFGKAVVPVQVEHRPQIHIGLAGAGLHLDGKMRALALLLGAVIGHQRLRRLNPVSLLHRTDAF